ncbi:MAG: hypothetical protein KBG22_14210 [Smithella sp.]|nr:hypothetical protein [Smithella sp.]MBP9014754.1 hypothetical protein [Smithella sp.]HNZ11896.1 GSU2403 family nucleotidyltransferase fold protein [Smithellaceae bacterium]
MEKEHDLFFAVLLSLKKAEVLRYIVLIGGWCPLVYKEYFGNPVEISAQRTADLDILVPNPPRIHKEIDVSLILNKLGFDRQVSPLDGYEKYVHPDLDVEFLTPERGRGREKPYTIDKLHVNAQGLRYLDLIQSHVMEISFRRILLNVPEPAAYVLHKFIVSGRRNKTFKREKDIETARQIGEYLLEHENQRKKMREIYLGMPEKWKKDLMKIVRGASEKIYAFLNSPEI